jgi:hypothetical protein
MLAALAAALLAAAAVVLTNLDSTAATHANPADPGAPTVSATVGRESTGRALPPGFVGLSLEYPAVPEYAGLVALIRNLSPGQRPVLRVGGNSTDETWRPQAGELAPRHAEYALTDAWLSATRGLAAALDARLILGVNLAGGSPAAAAAEARALARAIGPRYIQAFEIGNEPDLYGLFPWRTGGYRRPADYSLSDLIGEFSRWRAAIGRALPVAGPAYATFDWSLGRFIDAEAGLTLATFHHYPLDACLTKPSATGYPTVARLLGDQTSTGFAALLAPAVAAAHAHHLPFRLDELNSASCSGKWGVSNTFASALWILDTLFDLAREGVDGVNVHTFPGAAYAPLQRGVVRPEYYGMLLFAQAFPAGAHLLPVRVSPAGPLKVWATEGHGIRVVLINKDPRHAYQVRLRAAGLARIDLLSAPSAWSTGGITLRDRLIAPPVNGVYSITVPAASAAVLSQ